MLASALIVFVIAQPPGTLLLGAFEQTARRALGNGAQLQLTMVAEDPPDDQSAARAADVDGVVELSLSADGRRAHLHCYVSSERRWVDRDIDFGVASPSSPREETEQGRLLGFAVATMFGPPASAMTEGAAAETGVESNAAVKPPADAPAQPSVAPSPAVAGAVEVVNAPGAQLRGTLDFTAVASSGVHGTAEGLGASAAVRLRVGGPFWGRAVIAGRAGSIPSAQATTRLALAGAGLGAALLPEQSPFELGVRADAFVAHFAASHLSEDDVVPAERGRWLPGVDLAAEAGFRATDAVGVLASAGIEAVAGKTEIFTHGRRVATVPAIRAVLELGLRTRF